MRYVALLRGINVGGNNKVEMPKLQMTFENMGFTDVETYINTGNVIFTDKSHQPSEIIDMIEVALELNFELQIRIVLRDKNNIDELISKLPEAWSNDKEMKSDVMFLWPEVDSKDTVNQLTVKSGIDEVVYVPGAVLWSVTRDHQTKSGMQKLVGTKLYKQMTIRNVNTVRKIANLL